MGSSVVDLSGLDKALVLSALIRNSHSISPFARLILVQNPPTREWLLEKVEQGHIDYCYGIKICADLRRDTVNLSVYDRDSGLGSGLAKQVIDQLRNEQH